MKSVASGGGFRGRKLLKPGLDAEDACKENRRGDDRRVPAPRFRKAVDSTDTNASAPVGSGLDGLACLSSSSL